MPSLDIKAIKFIEVTDLFFWIFCWCNKKNGAWKYAP